VTSYAHAITKACDQACPHPTLSRVKPKDLTPDQRAELVAWHKTHRWHPHQLRHNAATALRARYGLEVAQVVLGHANADTAKIYAERDLARARAAMEEVG
jgi:integrase